MTPLTLPFFSFVLPVPVCVAVQVYVVLPEQSSLQYTRQFGKEGMPIFYPFSDQSVSYEINSY